MAIASLISTPSALCSTSTSTKAASFSLSSPFISHSKTLNYCPSTSISLLGLGGFSQWQGLNHLGFSIRPKFIRKERKGKGKGKVIYASLFGVGAPEALVIGVVALLVFGPKGLAEVARNLGKTLRAFRPTIRELQEVSRDFKSTLEREIGLDETLSQNQNMYNSNTTTSATTPPSVGSTETMPDPNGSPSENKAYTTEEYLKITEEQLKAAAEQQQHNQTPAPGESQLKPQTQPQESAASTPPRQNPDNEG